MRQPASKKGKNKTAKHRAAVVRRGLRIFMVARGYAPDAREEIGDQVEGLVLKALENQEHAIAERARLTAAAS